MRFRADGIEGSDASAKTFSAPGPDRAGLYIFRDSSGGQALKRLVSIDGKVIGQTANKVYFYREISPGTHTLSTESEFGDNTLVIQAIGGRHVFVRQSMKIGVFIGGSALELVSDEEGRKAVLQCERAEPLSARGSDPPPVLAFADAATRRIGQAAH